MKVLDAVTGGVPAGAAIGGPPKMVVPWPSANPPPEIASSVMPSKYFSQFSVIPVTRVGDGALLCRRRRTAPKLRKVSNVSV